MNKGVIVVLVVLAAAVLVAPAIVGRMAEKSMDENLNWAARESGELTVRSERFDRGWFSSEGRHRIELRDGQLVTALQGAGTDADEFPVLIVHTKIDHGIAQVATGAGDLVSTMQLELADGRIVDLPGTIYSKVGLGGSLRSNYVLEAGSLTEGEASATWGDADIAIEADPSTGEAEFDGEVGSLSIGDGKESLSLAGLTFEGTQKRTRFGLATGRIAFSLSDLTVRSPGNPPAGIRSMSVNAVTDMDDDRVGADASLSMAVHRVPRIGEMSFDVDLHLAGADAEALGRMQQAMKDARSSAQDPTAVAATIEDDLKQLFAAGFEMRFDRFEVTLPQGTAQMKMQLEFAKRDPATFDWTSLLLSAEATVDVSIPAAVVDTAGRDNPQVAMAVGGGFLVRQDDVYVMKAQLKKGLATVNGAPIPIPLGGF
ncbi:MAG: YdgA family protein [Proteobacteria bacterium]|nr:YdgA family protein [Pseudomonadota bacterium]